MTQQEKLLTLSNEELADRVMGLEIELEKALVENALHQESAYQLQIRIDRLKSAIHSVVQLID